MKVHRMTEKQMRENEIEYIYDLLKTVMEEEGYEIKSSTYASRGYKAFEIYLKNKIVENEKLMIKISFNHYD